MKNIRNICLVLVIPFCTTALAFAASTIAIREVERDITGIDWDYRATEGYSLLAGKQLLQAEAIYDKNYPLSAGNNLVWSVTNPGDSTEEIATVEQDGEDWYFIPENPGRVTVTCSNQKGNQNRSFTAVVYEKGAIIVNPEAAVSGRSISGTERFGWYDFQEDKEGNNIGKVKVGQNFYVDVIGDNQGTQNLKVSAKSDNISSCKFTKDGMELEFSAPGKAYITLQDYVLGDDEVLPTTYDFEVIDGVNVYDYDDLLDCTNRSETGENIVLRTDFGSLADFYEIDVETGRPLIENGEAVKKEKPTPNTALFGHYDEEKDVFSFEEEVYQFETTLDSPFIDGWNEFVKTNEGKKFKPYSTTINAGIHLKGDFYGNGFQLNMHDLCFPYEVHYRENEDGSRTSFVALREDNLFRGPRTYFAFGDPDINNLPIVATMGQDNCGVYIDTPNVSIVDAQILNCDLGENFDELEYTGSVLDIEAPNVTVEDSLIGNGRTGIRAYSAPNLTIDNSWLQNGYGYLLNIGSNKLYSTTNTKKINFQAEGEVAEVMGKDASYSGTVGLFFSTGGIGDDLLNSYLTTEADLSKIISLDVSGIGRGPYNINHSSYDSTLSQTQKFLDDTPTDENGNYVYDSTVNVKDSIFYRSGVSSINMDAALNGPYLYNRSPSTFQSVMALLNQFNDNRFAPYSVGRLNRTMAPSSLNISGDTKFYDWKRTSDLAFSNLYNADYSLLTDKIPTLADCTFDDFVPIRDAIRKGLDASGNLVSQEETEYLNIPVLVSGGGVNHSMVTYDSQVSEGLELDNKADYINEIATRDYKSLYPQEVAWNTMNLIAHALSTFLGFEPYTYSAATPSYSVGIDDIPQLATLQNHVLKQNR